MESIFNLVLTQNKVQQARQTVQTMVEKMNRELAIIAGKGKQYGVTPILQAEEVEIRNKYADMILTSYQTVSEADIELAGHRDAWLDIEHVLSTRPVSKMMAPHIYKPADPDSEARQRAAIIAELKNCSVKELSRRAEEAKKNGRHGELYLIYTENNTRAGQPGHEGIDLTGLHLPDQLQARRIFAEADCVKKELLIAARTARGVVVDPMEKLSYGHALAELEAL